MTDKALSASLAIAITLASSHVWGQQPEASSAPADSDKQNPSAPLIKKVGDHAFEIGKIKFNDKTKEIAFPVSLGSPDSIIEYLMVNEQGKIHETLLITEIRPLHLNLALKLLGYKESKELFRILDKDYIPTEKFHQEPEEVKKAARFNIFLEWQEGEEKRSHHINEFIFNSVSKKHAKLEPYVYGGSYLLEGRFKADLSGDLIAIFTDRGAIANFSNKGREDDTIWLPNKERLPKPNIPLTVVIRKHKLLGNP